MNRQVFLIGYRCTGKTSVARELGRALGCPVRDLDRALVETAGRPVSVIVEEEGWTGFRNRESAALDAAIASGIGVIATGGGIVTRRANIEKMKAAGLVVLLTAEPATIVKRMAEDAATSGQRPSLTGMDPREEVMAVLEERHGLYMEAADVIIGTDTRTPERIAQVICELLGKSEEKRA